MKEKKRKEPGGRWPHRALGRYILAAGLDSVHLRDSGACAWAQLRACATRLLEIDTTLAALEWLLNTPSSLRARKQASQRVTLNLKTLAA